MDCSKQNCRPAENLGPTVTILFFHLFVVTNSYPYREIVGWAWEDHCALRQDRRGQKPRRSVLRGAECRPGPTRGARGSLVGPTKQGKSNRAPSCPRSRALWPAARCSDFAAAAADSRLLGRPQTELRVRLPQPASGNAGRRYFKKMF